MKMTILQFRAERLISFQFPVCKWNTLHLQTRIKRHGDLSAYIEYLLAVYSTRVFSGMHLERDAYALRLGSKTKPMMMVECSVKESTYQGLCDLAQAARVGNRILLRLLFHWDLHGMSPFKKIA